VFYSDRVNIL
jgi:ribosome-binding factor A